MRPPVQTAVSGSHSAHAAALASQNHPSAQMQGAETKSCAPKAAASAPGGSTRWLLGSHRHRCVAASNRSAGAHRATLVFATAGGTAPPAMSGAVRFTRSATGVPCGPERESVPNVTAPPW